MADSLKDAQRELLHITRVLQPVLKNQLAEAREREIALLHHLIERTQMLLDGYRVELAELETADGGTVRDE